MSIEEELKAKFNDDHQKAMVNVLFTGSWLYNQNATFLKQFGITPEQFNVLRILRGSYPKPLRLADITERMIDKSSNCTRLVEKLRLKKMVTRELSATNRRQVDISVTGKGLQLLTEIDKQLDVFLGSMRRISKKEAKDLSLILDKLRG